MYIGVWVRRARLGVLAAMLLALLAACGGPGAGNLQPAWSGEIEVVKSATGFFEEQIEYDWTVEKSVTPESATLIEGDSATFTYTILADRSEASRTTVAGVRGSITVVNSGGGAIDAKIKDIVEYKDGDDQWQTVAEVVVEEQITLVQGQTGPLPYEIEFTPVEGATEYRNRAVVMLETDEAFEGTTAFTLPEQAESSAIDEAAEVSDSLACPDGFTCTPSSSGPWTFVHDGGVQHTVEVRNDDAACGEQVSLVNTATLTETDSQETDQDSATVIISTGECEEEMDLELTKTADPYAERELEYDWTVRKSVTPTSLELSAGDEASLRYTVDLDRVVASEVVSYFVRGEVCADNQGSGTLEGTVVVDTVGYVDGDGDFHALVTETIAADAELEPGVTCFDYDTSFTPVAGVDEYENRAVVSVAGESFMTTATFDLPSGASIVAEIDAEATLSDDLACPQGFTCTVSGSDSGTFSSDDSITYTVIVVNDSAECGQQVDLLNTATLVEGDTGEERSDSAEVPIFTGECVEAGGEGCTPGYWRQEHHYDSWEPTGYTPSQSFSSVFGVEITIKAKTSQRGPASSVTDPSLGLAVQAQGGDVNALARHAVAALLNASHPDVSYGYTEAEVIAMVRAALDGGDIEGTKNLLAAQNEMGCTLN